MDLILICVVIPRWVRDVCSLWMRVHWSCFSRCLAHQLGAERVLRGRTLARNHPNPFWGEEHFQVLRSRLCLFPAQFEEIWRNMCWTRTPPWNCQHCQLQLFGRHPISTVSDLSITLEDSENVQLSTIAVPAFQNIKFMKSSQKPSEHPMFST